MLLNLQNEYTQNNYILLIIIRFTTF